MKNQVREFGALLHQVDIGQAFHLVVKPVKADEFAEYDARVVEAKGLVKSLARRYCFTMKSTPSFCPPLRARTGLAARKLPHNYTLTAILGLAQE